MLISTLESAVWESSRRRDGRVSAEERRQAGVVHTPPGLARAQIVGLDRMLKDAGLSDGMCSRELVVVDLACGTGAFVAATLTHAHARGAAPRAIVATDVDSESLTVMQECCSGVAAGLDCDLRVRCENSLEQGVIPLAQPAAWVVVVGNPPWSVAKRRPSAAMQPLLEDFRRDAAGCRLVARKLGVLGDSYVQFFRLAVAYAELGTVGGGLGLWTNGSFLDGPNHRGMRRALLQGFSAVDVDDFGGNALLSRDPTLGTDQNLFGVRTSVALTIAVRSQVRAGTDTRAAKVAKTRVRYRRVRGTRLDKINGLSSSGTAGRAYVEVKSSAPWYSLVPSAAVPRRYSEAVGLHELMPFHREGVQTNRDAMVVASNRAELRARLQRFVSGTLEPEFKSVSRRTSHYNPEAAREAVEKAFREGGGDEPWLLPIAYRPMTTRVFCPLTPLCHRPRPALLRAMARSSLALVTVRQDRGTAEYRHAAIVSHVADSSYLSSRSSCRTRVFPQNTEEGVPNLDVQALAIVSERAERCLGVDEVMALAVALLHCPDYLGKYGQVLRRDYPRLVLPESSLAIQALIGAGLSICDAFLDESRVEPGRADTVQVGHHQVSTNVALATAMHKLKSFEF